jgi:hypothetical protein
MPLLKRQHLLLVGFLAGALAAVTGFWWLATRSDNIQFLPARAPAEWIVYPTPANGTGNPVVEFSTEFRRSFQLDQAPRSAALTVCSFKRGSILINGKSAGPPIPAGRKWKQSTNVEISGLLKPGTNEISVTVFNETGPPALWLTLTAGKTVLITDETWQASYAGAVWEPASLASRPPQIQRGNPMFG